MKRSRVSMGKKQRRAKIFMALLFLIVLPVTAIAIGSRITSWFIVPTINREGLLEGLEDLQDGKYLNGADLQDEDAYKDHDDYVEIEENENNSQEEAPRPPKEDRGGEEKGSLLNLRLPSFYAIQVASVASNDNIKLLTGELAAYKIPYVIHRVANGYKVYTYTATRREDLEGRIGRVREIFQDAYIDHISIPGRQIYYSAGEDKVAKEIVDNINLLLGLFDQGLGGLYSLEEGEMEDHRSLLVRIDSILKEISKDINRGNLPEGFIKVEDLKEFIGLQEDNIKQALKVIEEKGDPYILQNHFLEALFNSIDLAKEQVK